MSGRYASYWNAFLFEFDMIKILRSNKKLKYMYESSSYLQQGRSLVSDRPLLLRESHKCCSLSFSLCAWLFSPSEPRSDLCNTASDRSSTLPPPAANHASSSLSIVCPTTTSICLGCRRFLIGQYGINVLCVAVIVKY